MHMTVGYQPSDTATRDAMDVSFFDPQSIDHLRRDFIEEMTSVRRLLGMPLPELFLETTDPSQAHDRSTRTTTTAPQTPHTYAAGPSGYALSPSVPYMPQPIHLHMRVQVFNIRLYHFPVDFKGVIWTWIQARLLPTNMILIMLSTVLGGANQRDILWDVAPMVIDIRPQEHDLTSVFVAEPCENGDQWDFQLLRLRKKGDTLRCTSLEIMEGRRHSIDVPISKTLIALRRVRSLRDPSTNSMSKLSSLVDNLNWETNSNNAITLGFDYGCHKGTKDTNVPEWRRSTLFRDDEQHASDLELHYGSLHPNSMPQSSLHVECKDYSDCVEGGGSCNEPDDEISTQAEKRRNGESQCKMWQRKLGELSRVPDGDVLSRSGSPCLPIQSYRNEDVGFMESCHQGCGISSCWSRTRKFRDSNLLPDVEEQPLLLTGESLDSPYVESPRSLSQKFMPKSFGELVGQSTIATSLLSAISNRQITSLYLFHGPRGTGKTSASRIFAAALNCLSPEFAKPCGLCQECGLFFSGRSRDVKEVDSVRINRVEKCRVLVRNARVPPVFSRFKVYVIDECHLLNKETWAIILNGLEELPRNVVFIMVTPNLDKLPRSAVSKFQRYHFQRVKEVDIANRLGKICVQEGIEFDQDALSFIATKSNGSLRDAEMMLDQLSLLGKKITVSLVYEVNGVVSNDELLDLLQLALSSDASNTLANLIMDILAGKFPDGVSEARRKLFGTDNSEADMHQLSHALKILSQTEKQLRMSKNQTTWLTVALLQLSSVGPSHDVSNARLSTRTLNPPDSDFHSTSSTGESLKCSVACACDDVESEKIGIKDDKENLELVWLRAIGMCTSSSLKKFLLKRGKLVSIRLNNGTSVAELEFDRPDYVSKAEKSWKVIAGALQHILGYNVELRINLANNDAKLKKSYFSLFNCSRRVHLRSQFSAESNASENYDSTPTTIVTRDKYVETCSPECGSQILHTCCHGKEIFKTIRSKDGNALSIGMSTPSMARENQSGAYLWNERNNKGCPNSNAFEPESKPGSPKEYSKFRCWKTAMFPFRKAWQLRHQPRSERLVDYALHCAAAK
ncbi:hypothetical protein DH2020_019147 [Rehmannia glutinosa]|uniref:DNA-directed DNA polymerase n=1 Tax=Rehmannia glutinosa TaxID=99300 RepID=A0ABR0WM44_REHGL